MPNEAEGDVKNYWEDRPVQSANNFGTALKRARLTQGLTNLLFSVRTSDEAFIARAMKKRKVKSVLDVACGSGKSIIPSLAEYTAGVDIVGYPKELALGKGYTECAQYQPPDYSFEITRDVEAITSINLNAHVPFESYRKILDNALRFLRPGGILIVINEYDNDGISYRLMRRNPTKFDRMVKGMEHWYLEYEGDVLNRFKEAFGDMHLVERQPLIAGVLPSVHYYAYSRAREPSSLGRWAFILSDIPMSLLNSFQARVSPRFNRCFTVGYVFQKRD